MIKMSGYNPQDKATLAAELKHKVGCEGQSGQGDTFSQPVVGFPRASRVCTPSNSAPVPNHLASKELSGEEFPEVLEAQVANASIVGKIRLEERQARIAPSLVAYVLNPANGSLDSPYRLYEVLRSLDDGKGALPQQQVEEILTNCNNSCYLYGRRQLLEILKRGEGVFWHRGRDVNGTLKIWLHSRPKIAAQLGITFRGKEVELPLTFLIANSGDKKNRARQANANAAMYAAIHAGRSRPKKSHAIIEAMKLSEGENLAEQPAPISRNKIKEVTGLSGYRQRNYEKKAGIIVKRNFAILSGASDYAIARARENGIPAFRFVDYKKVLGNSEGNCDYVARQIPNTYITPPAYKPIFTNRTRKLNEAGERLRLNTLGANANAGHQTVEFKRVYYSNGKCAAKAWGRDTTRPAFSLRKETGTVGLWDCLPAVEQEEICR